MVHQHDRIRRPVGLVLAILVAFSACILSIGGMFDPAEDALTSWRAKSLTRQPTGETAIVEINARSLAELHSWPWPRRYHAQLVRQLHRSGASIIAFDVDFSARSEGGDEELAAAIGEAGHVILPIFEQRASSRRDDRSLISSRPYAAFDDAWVGGVNIFPDDDGVVREYPAATYINGSIQPSIATLLAEKDALGARSFQPDWAIDADRIPRLSFADVMNGRVPESSLRGKRILVGATAIELGDRYAVPRYGVMPGVVIQALAAESLLQDRAIQRTSSPVTFVGILLLALLLAPRRLGSLLRYASCWGVLVVAIFTIPFVAQQIWAVSIDAAAWLFTAVAAAIVQAVVEARRRLRLRDELDAESGLPNRTLLETAIKGAGEKSPILIAAAIERFDAIRDGIGLAATNEMIRKVARIIGKYVDGPVYRIAPDVLAWVQNSEVSATQQSFKDMQLAFREPVDTKASPVDVVFTLGMARHESGLPAVLLIEHALTAVTTARSQGKSREWYRATDPQPRRQLSMMSDLRESMDNGRLCLAYQPKLSLASGCIADAEALIRWRDANGNIVPPDEFIPLAEAMGVIPEVTIFALRTAAKDLSRWAKKGMAVRVAVNVSALDIGTAQFAETVSAILRDHAVPPEQLALEVTESALIRSAADVAATLSILRERGVRLSVDDYGTGQSTLSYLKHFPVHELKIDKSFVMSLAHSESDEIMVRSTINLAHELGLQVVAEGIEDQATLDILRKLGCDYAQGYFISKPIPPDEFIRLVSQTATTRRVA